ncbi:MAG: adenylate kinase [Lentisphaerae bacterium]|nr:adenylate kinase [Lentisphaerota bacterium]
MSAEAVILLGAPGAGKGTMAEGIREAGNFIHVSTGDMLREAVKAGTPLGREAESFMSKGMLVPDETILKIVRERLSHGGAEAHYLFDGFPRTLAQARGLDAELSASGVTLKTVLLLDVPPALSVQRLTGRRICRQCGANYHVQNIPPRRAGVCDVCGGELYQRLDDRRETILKRLEVFQEQTAGLIAYYHERGQLQRVDSSGPREATVAEIIKRLQ